LGVAELGICATKQIKLSLEIRCRWYFAEKNNE